MRSLMRLAVWGSIAAVALALAVISALSSTGSQRAAAAQPAAPDPETAVQMSRNADDLRRLTDAVRTLATDREQLITRIASIEHALDDVTGSIKRDTVAAPPAAAPPTTAAAVATPVPQPDAAGAPVAPSSSGETNPGADAAAEPLVAASGLGVDVGGAVNFEGLRTLWASTKRSNPALSEDLFPVVAVRENRKSRSVDLRLVIGPLANAEAATRLCATFSAARRYCQLVAFEGQRLSQIEQAPKAGASGRRATLGP